MSTSKQYRSRVMASVHETAEGLTAGGIMNTQTMREFDELCPLTGSFEELVQRHAAADPVFAKELITSLTEAGEHAEGKAVAARVRVIEAPDKRVGLRRRRRRPQKA